MDRKETTEIVIGQDSSVVRRTVVEEPLQITDAIAEAMSEGVSRKLPKLMRYGGNYGNVAVTVMNNSYSMWTVEIVTLPLRCHCNTESGIVVPVFDNRECPLLPMRWEVPKKLAMRLVIAMEVLSNDGGYSYYTNEQYLVAFDQGGRMWRIPISNLFGDLKLCHNMESVGCDNAMAAVARALETFEKSQWNDHLYNDASMERRQATKNMFRWSPMGDAFVQLPMEVPKDKDWTALCEKVAVEKLITNIIPPTVTV